MRSLWCDPVSSFSGRFYELPACRQHPKPVQQPHPPLWFGGFGDATFRRVADLGSGYYGFDQTPAEISVVRQRLAELLTERGRRIEDITISHGVYNRMPVSMETLAEYRDAGVDQFVVSLRGAEQSAMQEELERFGRELVGGF